MKTPGQKNIYIIGAGFAGRTIAQEITAKGIFGKVTAFLDDDSEKTGSKIDGVPVIGPIQAVIPLLKQEPLDEALIAIPGASREFLAATYQSLQRAGFQHIKILPGISQIIEGDAHLVQTREINPQDVLGRTPMVIGLKESLAYLRGKRVLITGAGGSIGSELARQLLSGGAERLYLFGHGENSIYQIDKDLRKLQHGGVGEKATIVPVIGEMKDRDYMFYILKKLKADVIFHCAAYKHVPLMEANPVAVIENNVFGTKNLIDAAQAAGVKRLVLISTDKAVEPVSVYGVSKFLCEKLIQKAASMTTGSLSAAMSKTHTTSFMSVRFGNVLGSRGSFLPLFLDQIANGGPVTVTDPLMERYFMTIPEACSLVLKAGGVGQNRGMYLLDMGEPLKIKDIAEYLIRFYGYEPGHEIKIEYSGIRPGERLNEPLWADYEMPEPTQYPGILLLKEDGKANDIDRLIDELSPICFLTPQKESQYRNKEYLLQTLQELIPSLRSGADA